MRATVVTSSVAYTSPHVLKGCRVATGACGSEVPLSLLQILGIAIAIAAVMVAVFLVFRDGEKKKDRG